MSYNNQSDLDDLQNKYSSRGVSDIMLGRIMNLAYESSHAYGYDEVANSFIGLMYDIFGMQNDDTSQADMG